VASGRGGAGVGLKPREAGGGALAPAFGALAARHLLRLLQQLEARRLVARVQRKRGLTALL
jgi:hypothetical protein